MSDYADRFRKSGILTRISDVRQFAETYPIQELSEPSRSSFLRFHRAVTLISNRLAQADPDLITTAAFKSLRAAVDPLTATVAQFKQTKDVGPLNTAVDAVLDHVLRLPILVAPEAAAEFPTLLQAFRMEAEEAMEAWRAKTDEFAQAHADAVQKSANLERAESDHASRFSAAIERFDQQLRDQQAKFSAEQQERGKQFNESIRQWTDSNAALIRESQQQLETVVQEERREHAETRQTAEALAKQSLDELTRHLEHAKRIVGLIGNTGMAGHYQKVANQEWWLAEIWRYAAVLFFILTAVLVWMVVSQVQATNYNWEVALFRLAVAAVLIAPAIYCARESTRHRRTESRNRQIELELASIHPFLETLPKEKAQAVIERKADQYFGRDVAGDEDGGVTLKDMKIRGEQMLKMLERISKIVNGAK